LRIYCQSNAVLGLLGQDSFKNVQN